MDEQITELEKLQQAAQLIEEMSQGRLQIRPSVAGLVYIRPQDDSNLGMDMRIDSIPGQPRYLDVHKGLSKKGLVAGLILRELDAQEVLNPDDSPEEHPDAPKETEDMDIQADESAGAGSDSLLEDEEPEETAEGSSGEDDAE